MTRLHPRGGGGERGSVRIVIPGLLLLIALAVGLLGVYGMGWEIWRGAQTYGWEPAECTIVRGGEVEDAGQYRFEVSYTWTRDGKTYTGDRLRPDYSGSSEISDAYRLAARYPAGETVGCWVDPDAPERATLERYRWTSAFWMLVPLIFVAIGGGGLVLLVRWRRGGSGGGTGGTTVPPVTAADLKGGKGTGCLVAFFLVFALFGLGFGVPFFLLPAMEAWGSRDWVEVPATVESSEVGVHSSDDGSTYSVDILYRYRYDGRDYRSGRYDFLTGSSSGYDSKAEIVARYPAGTETRAYVNPDDPASAVLSREFRGDWLFVLVPLIFTVVGLGGATITLVAARRVKRRQTAGIEEWRPEEPGDLAAGAGPRTLEAKWGALRKIGGSLFLALFWNGIVGVFVWQWWKGASTGNLDGCLTLFLVPFVLVGLLLLVNVPYQLLAAFNPRPVLTFDGGRLEPGGTISVAWRFRGNAGRIRQLKIVCIGKEAATYRRGTDTRTDSETFAEIVLVDTASPTETARGSAQLHIPEDTMHSFEAPHNKILWSLSLHGSIDRWPDVSDEFPLSVQPRRVEP